MPVVAVLSPMIELLMIMAAPLRDMTPPAFLPVLLATVMKLAVGLARCE